VCLSVCVCVSVCLCLYVSVCVCVVSAAERTGTTQYSVSVCLCLCVCLSLSLSLCVCMCVCSFRCGENWHDPVQCKWLKKWIKKCDDDSETSHWIAANTRVCFALIYTVFYSYANTSEWVKELCRITVNTRRHRVRCWFS